MNSLPAACFISCKSFIILSSGFAFFFSFFNFSIGGMSTHLSYCCAKEKRIFVVEDFCLQISFSIFAYLKSLQTKFKFHTFNNICAYEFSVLECVENELVGVDSTIYSPLKWNFENTTRLLFIQCISHIFR